MMTIDRKEGRQGGVTLARCVAGMGDPGYVARPLPDRLKATGVNFDIFDVGHVPGWEVLSAAELRRLRTLQR